jgi:hypothetical protein
MTKHGDAPPTVAEVLGRTAQELRGDRKLELVARAAKSAGLNWGTGRIADLEAGRVSPTLPTLLQLCIAFSDLLDRPIGLADFFDGDGLVSLNASTLVRLGDLRATLRGKRVGHDAPIGPHIDELIAKLGDELVAKLGMDDDDRRAEMVTDLRRHQREGPRVPYSTMMHPRVREVKRSFLEADYRLIASLRLDIPGDPGGFDHAAVAMEKLWGRSFSEERDQRGGPGANAQKRGRISRELKADLKAELKEAINGGDD